MFGLQRFVPLLGARLGAFAGSMGDVGIDDNFINSVKQRVTPGTSALSLLTSEVVTDRVKDTFTGLSPELTPATCPPIKRPNSAKSSPKTDKLQQPLMQKFAWRFRSAQTGQVTSL